MYSGRFDQDGTIAQIRIHFTIIMELLTWFQILEINLQVTITYN